MIGVVGTLFLRRTAAAFFPMLLVVATTEAVPARAAHAAALFDPSPAAAALGRLLPKATSQFTFIPEAKEGSGQDFFTVSGSAGAVRVAGTSPATLLRGVGWYLQNIAHVDIGLPGESTSALPAIVPGVPSPFTGTAVVPHRYVLNDTDNGYSGAYRTVGDYEHEIDVLALHGYNEVLVTVGAEQPYYQTLQKFGYTADELRAWIPAPEHQPWWLLQNMFGLDGPVSDGLIAARATVGRQLCEHLRALGMTPVLPGYYGTVPTDFAARNPGANVVPQGRWAGGLERDGWLDPTGPVFADLAAEYYAEQRSDFGAGSMYKMDPWHEGGTNGTVDETAAASAIQKALLAAHPGAIWAVLGWNDNPTAALLAGVDKTKMLILDGESDWSATLNRESDWSGTPYAFGSISNFGGRSTLGAHTADWVASFPAQRTKAGSTLRGIAYMPESTTTNPAAMELFGDLAWSAAPIDQAAWFQNFAGYRYGGADPSAAGAWAQLRQGPYSTPADASGLPQDDVFTQRPSLDAPGAKEDPATVHAALDDLLAVAPALQNTDAYRFDIVDVARQDLDDQGRVLLGRIADAYHAKDLATFRSLVTEWDTDLASLDDLLSADSRFMVGTWIAQASAWGGTTAEKHQYEHDARSLITTWGDAENEVYDTLHDYANREWSGLVSDLYARRWDGYFASLDTALATNTNPAAIDYFQQYDNPWASATDSYPTKPSADPVAAARAVAALLRAQAGG
jgi:alpha-N-acetylglucosaminidase (NAGLU)-like protein